MGWVPEPRLLLSLLLLVLELAWRGDNLPLPPDENSNSLPGPGSLDTCQHTIWDDNGGPKKVQIVYGTCSEGGLDWKYPYGSVRLILQPDYRHTDFEACFLARSHFVMAKISLEDGMEPNEEEDIYNDSRLKPLALLNRTNPQTEREVCLKSSGDPISLFLEVDADINAAALGHVEIQYDLHRSYTHYSHDDMEDCRPCTGAEILREVCTSDFVVHGGIDAVFHHDEFGESEIHVAASKVYRQRLPLFDSVDQAGSQSDAKSTPSQSLFYSTQRLPKSTVYFPRKCGARQAQGEYMFMGRIRLGKALLKCVPRLKDFNRIWDKAVNNAENWCTLETKKS